MDKDEIRALIREELRACFTEWLGKPKTRACRKKPEYGPQERLSRDLASALGSSLPPCRKAVAALVGRGMTLESLHPQLGNAIPGMAPWDWAKHVTGGGASTGAAPVMNQQYPCPACGKAASAAPTDLCYECLVKERVR